MCKVNYTYCYVGEAQAAAASRAKISAFCSPAIMCRKGDDDAVTIRLLPGRLLRYVGRGKA